MSPVPRGGRLALVAALSVFAPAAFAGSAAADVNPDHLSDVPRAQPKVLGRPVPNSILFAWRWSRSGVHTIAFAPGEPNLKEGGPFLDLDAYLVTR